MEHFRGVTTTLWAVCRGGATGPGAAFRTATGSANCGRVNKVNLSEKLALIQEPYVPKIVGELNGQYIKLVKFAGPYVWHDHQNEDEMFLVLKGRIRIELRDETIELERGEMFIVPKGVEHRPVADGEAEILLFEPAATVNTGAVEHAYTKAPEELERI